MLTSYIKLNAGGKISVDDKQVIQAMCQYDNLHPDNTYYDAGHAPWLIEGIKRVGAYKWAVWYRGKCYPGKYIIRLATGIAFDDFHGGWSAGQANWTFEKLGFRVTPRPELGKYWGR